MKKCDLCGKNLVENGKDILELNRPYEMPYEIKWNGANCKLENRVVNCICEECINEITEVVKKRRDLELDRVLSW